MLVQFTVKNYRSIRNEMTLDMQAANISEHAHSLITDTDGEQFLPLTIIYGPNGAGKSTILMALYSLVCKVMNPVNAIKGTKVSSQLQIDIKPFAFSEGATCEPTEYLLYFRTKTAEYQYELSVKENKIIYEAMYRKKKETGARKSLLFNRTAEHIQLKGDLKRCYVDDISNELPLLSYFMIMYGKNEVIKDLATWFGLQIDYIDYSHADVAMNIAMIEHPRVKKLMIKMLREMDIDVTDYRLEKKNDNSTKVYTTHQVDGKDYELDFDDESNGTMKVFGALPRIAHALLEGDILIIDELDAKMHPLLLKYIITLFTNPKSNRKGAQLLFTSHDLSTMNKDILRRDEVWFVAKGHDQSSTLYSLVDFKDEEGNRVRKDGSISKQYLEGRFGADPYVKKIIDWEEETK